MHLELYVKSLVGIIFWVYNFTSMKRNSLTPRHDQLVIPPSLTGLAQRRRDDGSNNDVGWLLGKARLADSIQQFHHSESENCLVLQHS